MAKNSDRDTKVLTNMKALAIDMITEANSGHPGIVLSAAPIVHTLFSRYLIINPKDPNWINRDRVVLSAGHGSALLYSAMFMAGFHLTLEDMKSFRKFDSKLPGHPDCLITPGVDVSTGSLGQGIANGVGMAIAERFLENKLVLDEGKNLQSLIDYYTYVICGDGDIMEGVAEEAMVIAGNLGLGRLILLYDANEMTLDGPSLISISADIIKKYEASNWQVIEVKDGESVANIDKAIKRARLELNKPSLIVVRNIIGRDSVLEGTKEVHGNPLTKEQVTALKIKWDIPDKPFFVTKEAVAIMQKSMLDRNTPIYNDFQLKLVKFREDPNIASLIDHLNNINHPINLDNTTFSLNQIDNTLRGLNGEVMNTIASQVPFLMSASADVFSTTKTYLTEGGNFFKDSPLGRNIWCGVREHAMGAIMNGIALVGLVPVGSTFLVFSDNIKPAIRMSAIMKLPVIYVFTHDSYKIGQDGATHQPIEQLAMLRNIPNLRVYRPADVNEIVGAWKHILENRNAPSALVLARQEVDKLEFGNAGGVVYGAYLVRKETNHLSGVIIATGSEVADAIRVANKLMEKGIDLRVISMPCMELYKEQSEEYKQALLPHGFKTFVIEAGSKMPWLGLVANEQYIFGIDHFGSSSDGDTLQKELGLDINTLAEKIESML